MWPKKKITPSKQAVGGGGRGRPGPHVFFIFMVGILLNKPWNNDIEFYKFKLSMLWTFDLNVVRGFLTLCWYNLGLAISSMVILLMILLLLLLICTEKYSCYIWLYVLYIYMYKPLLIIYRSYELWKHDLYWSAATVWEPCPMVVILDVNQD